MSEPTAVNADPPEMAPDAPRKEVVAGSVNAEEKASIALSLSRGGFRNVSEGVREVCLAYRDSADVRSAVHAYLISQMRAA